MSAHTSFNRKQWGINLLKGTVLLSQPAMHPPRPISGEAWSARVKRHISLPLKNLKVLPA